MVIRQDSEKQFNGWELRFSLSWQGGRQRRMPQFGLITSSNPKGGYKLYKFSLQEVS